MRVAIVAGICVEGDAISAALAAQAEIAATLPGVTAVDIFVEHLDRPVPCAGHVVGDPWSLLCHEVFSRADVAVFHFGIRYSLFEALAGLDTGRTRPVVHFHNVTPVELVADADRVAIERSHVQLMSSLSADPTFWYYSEYNRRTLLSWGIPPSRLRFVPFPIEPPRPLRPRTDERTLSLLSVGRLVPAKGTHVILEGVAAARDALSRPVHLTIVGNPAFGNTDYVEELTTMLDTNDLHDTVTIVGDADEERLWQCYETADVVISASMHEGLCVPVVEAYLAGCRVIGTTAGNLPFIVQPPDPVVEPGDPQALADAIVALDRELGAAPRPRRDETTDVCRRFSRAATRQSMEVALRDGPTGSAAGDD